jgi:predicted O-linked N-acetylglucosamine transferase (SPINDLY family)
MAINGDSDQGELLSQARSLLRKNLHDAAGRAIARLLEVAPANVEALTLHAQLALHAGRVEEALQAVDGALRLAPDSAPLHYTRGRICKARGELVQALECYRRAAQADPSNPDILTSLGIALRGAGRPDEAIAAYRRALAVKPDHILAKTNLANVLEAQGDRTAGGALRETARKTLIDNVQRVHRQALELVAQGKPHAALGLLQEILAAAPNTVTLLWAAGLASDCGKLNLGLSIVDRLLTIEPDNVRALRLACLIAVGLGLIDRLPRYAEPLMRLAPSDEVPLLVRLSLSAIEDSCDSIRGTRARYEAAIDDLSALDLKINDPGALVGVQSFFLAYHGECDRDLQVKAARLYAQALPLLSFVSPHCSRPRRRPGKIRIGFISRYFYLHSIGKTSRGLIEKFDRQRFEVHVLRVRPSPADDTTELIKIAADRYIEVSGDLCELPATHRQLAALELDILFYQDIGMDPLTYFLAFARLAPVQCVSFGHPNTTGVPAMDYFVSNDLYEIAESPQHYSERLALLHDLPTLAYYYKPEVPRELPPRAALGLPEDAALYVCPQTLFKIHPEFDELLKRILECDPRGRIIFIRAEVQQWTERLLARFRRTMPEVVDRILFLPSLSGLRFMELLAVSDVMLDPLHFNGMNSSLEALAVGLPVVTLPSRLQRGRHTQAMYRKMGITDCIATSAADYVDIAVRLGTDAERRREVKARILERNGALYEDPRVVREFERFFESALHE